MALDRVHIDKVAKRYGNERALAGVSLELAAGSMCALLGHNGAGKTTLLGVVSTLVRPTAGKVTYRSSGSDVSGAAVRREIGLLAHASLCYGELTAVENLELVAGLYELAAADIPAVLDRVGLEPRARLRQARTYSRGMLQRLALARALLTKPSLLLLDEPFTGLDRGGALALGEQLGSLKASGAIVVVVTHDLEAIAGRTDHVAILRRGALVFEARGDLLVRRAQGPLSPARQLMLRLAAVIAWKDLRIELRSKEILATMAFFGALLVVIYSFAFPRDAAAVRGSVPGMLWVAIAFTGTIALGRAFDRERENDTMRALLLSPVPRLSVFLGKAISMAALVLAVAVICAPLLALFLDAPLLDYPAELALVIVLGAVGIAVIGSVFAATLLKVRSRDVLLPVVLYPLLVPLFVAGTKTTASLVAVHPNLEAAHYWIQFLGIYDAAFLVLSLWVFESLVIE